MIRPVLEICVESSEDLEAAVKGGADRIELCAALSLGGVTPSFGFMQLAKTCGLPVRVMIRPRGGDFVYNEDDLNIMYHDIDKVKEAGLAGVVFGANRKDDTLDVPVLQKLIRHADGLDTALHRAIDLTPDPVAAAQIAADLGFTTILTSGGASRAEDGCACIAKMQQAVGGRLEIMAGSKVTPHNAAEILSKTKIMALHASASLACAAPESKSVSMGYAPAIKKMTCPEIVKQLHQIIHAEFAIRA